jgi:hypothetical protein
MPTLTTTHTRTRHILINLNGYRGVLAPLPGPYYRDIELNGFVITEGPEAVCDVCESYPLKLLFVRDLLANPSSFYHSGTVLCRDCASDLASSYRVRDYYNWMRRWAQRQRRSRRAWQQRQEEARQEIALAFGLDGMAAILGASANPAGENILTHTHTFSPLMMETLRFPEDIIQDSILPPTPPELARLHQRGYALGIAARLDVPRLRNGLYTAEVRRGDLTEQVPFRLHTVQSGGLTGARLIRIPWDGYADGWRAVAALPYRAGHALIDYQGLLDPHFGDAALRALYNSEPDSRCVICNGPVRRRTTGQLFCNSHLDWEFRETEEGWLYSGVRYDWGESPSLTRRDALARVPRSEVRTTLVQ